MNIKEVLPGYKTKLVAFIVAVSPLAALLGFEFDPAQVAQFVEDAYAWVAVGYAGLGAAAFWFRDLADR